VHLYSDHTSKALRYSTRSQGISHFYLHTPRSSANGMNHTCLAFPAEPGTHLLKPIYHKIHVLCLTTVLFTSCKFVRYITLHWSQHYSVAYVHW